MKLRQTTPRDGLRWMLAGVSRLRAAPMALTGLFAAAMFTLSLLLGLPGLGGLLVAALMPALTAGWHEVGRAMQSGEMPRLTQLLAPLRGPARPTLLGLGLLHAFGAWMLLALGDLLDPGMAEAWEAFHDSEAASDAMLATVATLQQGMVLRAALLIPLVLLFWHAPVVATRTQAGLAKSLFVSATATLRHLGAMVVYGLCWIGADLLLSAVLAALVTLLGLGPAGMVLVMPAALMFSAAFYASLQASIDGCIDFEN